MAYGNVVDWLAEEAAAGDRAAQRAFEVRSDVAPHLFFVWRAFSELSTDRPATVAGFGPIPFSAIDAYARRFALDGRTHFERFLGLIRRLDAAYLAQKKKPGS